MRAPVHYLSLVNVWHRWPVDPTNTSPYARRSMLRAVLAARHMDLSRRGKGNRAFSRIAAERAKALAVR